MAKRKGQMSIKERQERAAIRQQLRDEGLIRPKKKPLNRTKFAKEVIDEWETYQMSNEDIALLIIDLPLAFVAMTTGTTHKATAEQIGALKVIKIAMEMYKYKKCANIDWNKCDLKELYREIVLPIINL